MLAHGTAIGAKLVMMHKWQPERALELIERERVTSFGGVPAMVWQVLESPAFGTRDTSSVIAVGYGGAPAAPELVRRIKQVFPEVSASNGYGLTETSAIATSNSGIDYERKPDSIGLPMPICDVKVVGEDGSALPPGSVGELCIRGPNVVKGYWNKPEATAASFRDGWLHTGDVVRIDEEGFVYVLDRAKDMLIRGGENVYCVEVENVLYQHPAVMDAAVIGIPHRVLGEEVGAVVQVTPGAQVSAEALREHAARHLAAFKVPVRIEIRTSRCRATPTARSSSASSRPSCSARTELRASAWGAEGGRARLRAASPALGSCCAAAACIACSALASALRTALRSVLRTSAACLLRRPIHALARCSSRHP